MTTNKHTPISDVEYAKYQAQEEIAKANVKKLNSYDALVDALREIYDMKDNTINDASFLLDMATEIAEQALKDMRE